MFLRLLRSRCLVCICMGRYVCHSGVCMVWTLVSGRRRCVDCRQNKACVPDWGGLGCGCWAVCGDVRVRYIGLVQGL
jgi:hypothetical protein